MTGQGAMVINGKRADLGYKEDIFYYEGDEILAQVARNGSRCLIPGNIQGQMDRDLRNLI